MSASVTRSSLKASCKTEAFCKDMASSLEKRANDVHNAGTGEFIPEEQILTSTQQNMEPPSVTDESVKTLENDKATKISSADSVLEDSSNGLKSDKKIGGSRASMTRVEQKAKLKEFSTNIYVSARNLQGHIEYAENMKTVTGVSQKEVEDMSKKLEQYMSIHLKLEETLAVKIKKLNDALKNLTQGEEMIDSEFCEILEEVTYKNKEVLLAQPRVLKLPEDELDSDSDERSDQPINYDPPSVPRATQVICKKCNKVFKNMKDYYRHKKEHYHSKFFNCKSCPQVFCK